ncbi:MAG TPA: GGDEF domain-containing protein [Solirubrobacterales bacterium]|nr:GGDEF domain-containing protein [Solirubrobacterales bacterium]
MIIRLLRNHTHAATDGIALGLIALVLLYNGTIDVPDISETKENWLIATCLVGGVICLVLSVLCLTRRIVSPAGLEAAMALGLIAAAGANFVTGDLWPDSIWITCGYTMTLTVAAGLTLRSPVVFGAIVLLLFATWMAAAELHTGRFVSRGDATTLVIIGGFIALGVFWILRIEREAQDTLTRRLRDQLDHDALTGVLNRTGLTARIDGLRAAADPGGTVWCAYADVDFFKSINDRRGHDYGDEVLREIARGLTETCGDSGLVARWGGDEFVIMASGEAPTEAEIEDQVAANLDRAGLEAAVTAGVASVAWTENLDSAVIIERADLRMYERRDAVRSVVPGQVEISLDPPSNDS